MAQAKIMPSSPDDSPMTSFFMVNINVNV